MLPVEEESTRFTIMIYTSTIGATLACIISSILLYNVIYNYLKLNKQKQSSSIKISYFLESGYLISSALASFFYAFVRTNVITRISMDQFTTLQCSISYVMSYNMYCISDCIFYTIYIWRIDKSLKDTAFGYHRYILYTFFVMIAIPILIVCSAVSYDALVIPKWVLLENNGIGICANQAISSSMADNRLSFSLIVGYLLFVYSILFKSIGNGALLFMFTRGLWKVNALFIKSYATEHCDKHEVPNDTSAGDIALQRTDINVIFEKYSNQQTISPRVKHILIIHDLIKKQTILVSITALSSVIFLLLLPVDIRLSVLIHWDTIINVICTWLMLGSSMKYWRYCTKTCLRCCYRKENSMS